MHWPYDVHAAELKAAIDRAGVTMLGINAPVGDKSRGENGLAAVPGPEADFAKTFDLALSYAVALGGTAVHCLAGVAKGEAAEATYVKNLADAADKAAKTIHQNQAGGFSSALHAHAASYDQGSSFLLCYAPDDLREARRDRRHLLAKPPDQANRLSRLDVLERDRT